MMVLRIAVVYFRMQHVSSKAMIMITRERAKEFSVAHVRCERPIVERLGTHYNMYKIGIFAPQSLRKMQHFVCFSDRLAAVLYSLKSTVYLRMNLIFFLTKTLLTL